MWIVIKNIISIEDDKPILRIGSHFKSKPAIADKFPNHFGYFESEETAQKELNPKIWNRYLRLKEFWQKKII